MNDKLLGKISSAKFCLDDNRIGIRFELSGAGWGTTDSWSFNSKRVTTDAGLDNITQHGSLGWELMKQHAALAGISFRIADTLKEAKVQSIDRLVGIPIEATFDGNLLKSWRVLTEVL